jgi:hypothetical protein
MKVDLTREEIRILIQMMSSVTVQLDTAQRLLELRKKLQLATVQRETKVKKKDDQTS